MQQRLFDPSKLSSQQFAPVDFVVEGLTQYTKEKGMPVPTPVNPQLQVDYQRGYATNVAYRQAMANPQNAHGIEDSYKAAADHIRSQYEFMTRPVEHGGLGIKHEIVREDPYPSAEAMADDLRTNRRIRTFATASSAEGETQSPTLQAFDNDTNDMLRAVHDVFGHAATGRGFSRHGEEAAFQLHRQVFPKEAHAAMTSELRGQNSYLNFGPDREFPDPGSRMIGLPEWASGVGKLPDAPQPRRKEPDYEQLRLDV